MLQFFIIKNLHQHRTELDNLEQEGLTDEIRSTFEKFIDKIEDLYDKLFEEFIG